MIVAMNPRRRRRRNRSRRGRRHNPMAYNGHRRRRRNGRRGRRHHRNPSLAGKLGAVGAAFNTELMKGATIVVSTSYLNNFITQKQVDGLGRYLPAFLVSSPGNYILGLVNASLAYAAAKKFAPKYASSILFGFALDPITRAFNRYAVPALKLTPLKGLADYLTVGDASRARPLMGLEDYLTVGDASRARPLMGLADCGEMAEADELES